MVKKLAQKKTATLVRTLAPEWSLDSDATHLILVVPCRTYLLGFMLVTKIAIHAEVQKYYPTITLSGKRVKISLTTPSAKGVTLLDVSFAKQIDQLLLSTKR